MGVCCKRIWSRGVELLVHRGGGDIRPRNVLCDVVIIIFPAKIAWGHYMISVRCRWSKWVKIMWGAPGLA